MFRRDRLVLRGIAGLLSIGSLALASCREEQTPKRATPTTAESPTPGRIPEPVDTGKAAATGAGVRTAGGVDQQDDPLAPACLPKSGEAAGWVKVAPVRVADAFKLGELMTPTEAARLAYFRIALAARVAYALPGHDAETDRAHVLVVEMHSADDAYGMMTCQSSSTQTVKAGGLTRAEHRAGLHFHCWQGRSYLHAWADQPSVDIADQLLQLLRSIAGRIPPEDAPEILEALPKNPAAARHWLVRHLASLPPDALGLASPPDATKVSDLLGLGQDTLMVVGAYEVPEGRQLNVVWVVRYPNPQVAAGAFGRYTQHLSLAADAQAQATSLLPPKGQYLVGTWTIEEESLQHLMPRIIELLPS